MKVVIVGGVAGGASAAARLRRLDETAQIVLVERGAEPSFANCGMPYYIGGEIASRDKLLVAPVEMLRERHRLDVRTRQEVIAIDREAKSVRIRDLNEGREYEESYDKLILAPGAAPIRPPIPGIDLPGVYTLRNLSDADRLRTATLEAKRALIVGGGFIGVEMAENLVRRGVETVLVERNSQVLTPWDAEMVASMAERLTEARVDLRLNNEVVAFHKANDSLEAELKSGERLPIDFAVLAIGVKPESCLAVEAGLEVGARGGIVVDEQMRTSDPNIFAVGDAVQVTHYVTGQPTQIPLAGPANRQGRIAAEACVGRLSEFNGVQGTAVVGLFDKTAAMTGLSEKACRAAGITFDKVYLHPAHHAGYYPGAEGMTLKLLFSPDDGKVLGAQAVGGSGVDKRIDVIAVAIQAALTVFDLEEAELCYAPQYGSAKDPVNMAGFIAAGVMHDEHPVIYAEEIVEGFLPEDVILLDVRTRDEHDRGAIPGALNIPIEELRERLNELPAEQPVVSYCQVGVRGYLATRVLLQSGRGAANLSGGYTTYRQVMAARKLASQ
ncbi:FAD-dependent oxidoreductase [Botrimarina mediterranea]|uniref:FAD-dependent oxidoreductase n=1 Tax=Botrimarina mediterranea TaxID=2528022 RepID=UPI00118C331D|nr:Coenzyme A disulfide reductase [Planctomycetes bacterium K2D]